MSITPQISRIFATAGTQLFPPNSANMRYSTLMFPPELTVLNKISLPDHQGLTSITQWTCALSSLNIIFLAEDGIE
jgi:hypothetical protein